MTKYVYRYFNTKTQKYERPIYKILGHAKNFKPKWTPLEIHKFTLENPEVIL